MPINPNLLVSAAMLQDYFVDKDSGLPLSAGVISLYVDTARSFYKNWYYQTGSPGAYTYIPLDNPLILSGAGTIQDQDGNDIIPFYYPYDENNEDQPQAYYITVYNSAGVLQFTRENFPFEPSGISPDSSVPSWRNYILNNVYWRNIGTLDATNITNQVIAPSQHDGYTNGDITFVKSITGATDTIEFLPMTATLINDITPELYINFTCSNTQSGETLKAIQYPISLHVDTLNSVTGTIKIHAQNVSGNANNYIDLYFYQFLGTGAISQPAPIFIQRIILNNNFDMYAVPFITPSTDGLVLGEGGDDALFLLIQFPLSVTCEINHTKPQIYFSDQVPDNDFDTYDQVETIINSARTGEIRTSLNSFMPGFVLCNDGLILSSGTTAPSGISIARKNNDAWPLYNLLWPLLSVPAYNSSGATTKGGTAYADFTTNGISLLLPLAVGRALLGLPPALTTAYTYNSAPSWNSGVNGFFTSASTTLLYVGAPIYLTGTLPPSGNFAANTIYYAIPAIDGSSTATFQLASSYANAIAGTAIAAGSASGNGSNIIVNFVLGGSFGESRHIQLLNQLVSHTHPAPSGNFVVTTGGAAAYTGGVGGGQQGNTGATGNGYPFNVVNPATYMNVFIKL